MGQYCAQSDCQNELAGTPLTLYALFFIFWLYVRKKIRVASVSPDIQQLILSLYIHLVAGEGLHVTVTALA